MLRSECVAVAVSLDGELENGRREGDEEEEMREEGMSHRTHARGPEQSRGPEEGCSCLGLARVLVGAFAAGEACR